MAVDRTYLEDGGETHEFHADDVAIGHEHLALDALVDAAAALCDTPIAFVALYDHREPAGHMTWSRGLVDPAVVVPLARATISSNEVVTESPDVRFDQRFGEVGSAGGAGRVSFYAGVPICAGHSKPVAVIAVAAHGPGQLSLRQRDGLIGLSVVADRLLQMSCDFDSKRDSEVDAYRDDLEDTNARLQSDVAHKHMLIQSIGRDLSAPIAAIRITAESITSGAPAHLATPVAQLGHYAREAEAMVSDLLRVAEPGRARHELRLECVDLAPVLSAAISSMSLPPSPQVEVELDPVVAEVDPHAISRVVVNVVKNAIRHTPRRTPISVVLRRDEHHALIEVSDLGHGIAEADRDRVLSAYHFQAGPEDVGGAGLGLTIADALVRAHGGTVMLGDNEPHGTVVAIRLPIRSAREAESGSPDEARS